jgi:hypothetical protein
VHYFVEVYGFAIGGLAICGIIIKICGFAIYGLAQFADLQ